MSSPEPAASLLPLLEAIERRQRRMEQRQRRMELVLGVLLAAVLAGQLAAGSAAAFTNTILVSAVLGYAWVVRGVRADARDRPVPASGESEPR